MRLDELKKGQEGKIVSIGKIGELKRRLTDMGITSGTIIKFARNAPLGDPQAFIVKGTGISIRREDAKYIEVEEISKG